MHYPRFLIIVIFALIIFVSGCDVLIESLQTPPMQDSAAPVDEALIARGIEVYRVNYCGSCHTLTAANTRGAFGPAHNEAAAHAAEYILLATYSGMATNPEAYIRESILNPTVFYTPGFEATNHHMPAFTHLPEADIEAMVYMLANQPYTLDPQ